MKKPSRAEMRQLLEVDLRFDAKSHPDPGVALPVVSSVINRIEEVLRDPIDLDGYLEPLVLTRQRLKELPSERAYVHGEIKALKDKQALSPGKPGWFRSLIDKLGGGLTEQAVLEKVQENLGAEWRRLNDLVLQQTEDFSMAKSFAQQLSERLTRYRENRTAFEAMLLLEEQGKALAAARFSAGESYEKAVGALDRKLAARERLQLRQEVLSEDVAKQRRLCAEIVAGESTEGLKAAQAVLAAAETSLHLQIEAVKVVDEQVHALESEVRRAEKLVEVEDRNRDRHEVKLLDLRSRRAAQVAAEAFQSLVLPNDALPAKMTAGPFGLYGQAMGYLQGQLAIPGR